RPWASCRSPYRALAVLSGSRGTQRTNGRPDRSVVVREPEYSPVVKDPACMLSVQRRSNQEVESRDSGGPVRISENVIHGNRVDMIHPAGRPVIDFDGWRMSLHQQVHELKDPA